LSVLMTLIAHVQREDDADEDGCRAEDADFELF
jgi:hypothetical protein